MTADPISAVCWREREIIQTATKDTLTFNSADETDKSDNKNCEHNPQRGPTHPAQVTDTDVSMMALWKMCADTFSLAAAT